MSADTPEPVFNIIPEIAAVDDELRRWRHALHANPELAFKEYDTSAFVAEKLRSFGVETATGLGGTGVVGVLRKGTSNASIGLRADLDALAIQEATGLPHQSRNDGVMHACGHDGHSVMLIAAARYLAERGTFDGTVYFIFQPAEENEGGAQAMIDGGLFAQFPCDAIYAIHNAPGAPFGAVATRPGAFLASMDMFELIVRDTGGHAATPHLCRDTIMAAIQVATAWQTIVSRQVPASDSAVVSITQFQAGETWNALPGEAVLRGTVRTHCPETQAMIERELRNMAENICSAMGVDCSFSYDRRYPPLINSPAETKRAVDVAAQIVPQSHIYDNAPAVMGSDDFAAMLQERPGCYFWLGSGDSGDSRMLHDPRYDFEDRLLPIGASIWVRMAEAMLPKAV
ncbi:M20 aminoacylase family protein [Erythrobacter sp. AP23]|uniref:M20 aminoacylase family protein n=1 Tax=Erythrobacter sp. AP23 TaxID=499656 RepID=UPI00076C854E|nr:M20 aminoacylase family protein [Erythrobacter sp. AP23]KWV93770.1 hypothetical protein ASS64_12810 [Erythrobacter sp. AP23]